MDVRPRYGLILGNLPYIGQWAWIVGTGGPGMAGPDGTGSASPRDPPETGRLLAGPPFTDKNRLR